MTQPAGAGANAARRVALPPVSHEPVPPTGTRHRMIGATMGTTWAVSLVVPDGVALADVRHDIEVVLETIVAQMSTWREDSTLCVFNRAEPGTIHTLPQPFFTVLSAAVDCARLSGGAYDPTVGPLVDVWGFGPQPSAGHPPNEVSRLAAERRIGWHRLDLDPARGTVRQPGGLALDLSAIAKGYAVDALVAVLQARGVSSALVDIGGELRGLGVTTTGVPWWVSIDRPDGGSSEDDLVIGLFDLSVASSGDYRRYFECEGRRYAHTIDPRTGRPITHDVASVTVVHRECMVADALSTALTVLGVDEGLALCETHDIAALFLRRGAHGYEEQYSPAFAALLA